MLSENLIINKKLLENNLNNKIFTNGSKYTWEGFKSYLIAKCPHKLIFSSQRLLQMIENFSFIINWLFTWVIVPKDNWSIKKRY